MGKSVRAHTVRFHNRIKKEKLQKLEDRRLEAITARAAANLAKHNIGRMASEHPMTSLTPDDVASAKILVEEEVSTSNMMDLVENLDHIPTSGASSMKKKRQAGRHGRM